MCPEVRQLSMKQCVKAVMSSDRLVVRVIYTLFQKFSIIVFEKEAEMSGKNKSQCFKILMLAFLSDVMVIKETIRIYSGLKSAFIKIQPFSALLK